MRIGIMLRHFRQHGGGVRVYTESLLREMLSNTTSHEFILFYNDPELIGTYGEHHHVREVALRAPSVLLWDQVAVPRAAKREKVDLIFNLKYSIPLATQCRTVWVCHGLDWYVVPQWSRWMDRLSHRYLIPRYAQKADIIIAVSDTTRKHVIEYLGVDEGRLRTVYLGVDDAFRLPIPQEKLEEIRRTYRLPDRFFLYCGQIYPPKNFGRLLRAYARVGPALGIALVVAGEHRWLSKQELGLIDKINLSSWVVQLKWVDRVMLPAFYTLAAALLLPSLYESFGLPILEAMASGCPIVTANRYGTREIAGSAAVLVDPENVDDIAQGIYRVATDPSLRQQLVQAGRERVQGFSWKKCAQETLLALEAA
jgi:glycosyltransferase involved in cell wall biosynthesis